MKKLITKELQFIIPENDSTWEFFENIRETTEPFFLLFKAFSPYASFLNLPSTIKNTNENIIFVRHKRLERDIIRMDSQGNVVEFLFKPFLDLYEPFALFSYKNLNIADHNIERLLNEIAKGKYKIEKV